MTNDARWWSPARHADRRAALITRNRLRRTLTDWFEAEDFVQVECPALQVSPGNEAHLHAFATTLLGPDGVPRPRYLHTSPEFTMKKLIAAGETRIFDFARVWRNRERTALHHPEFTMLEWYRVGSPYQDLMRDCADLLAIAATTAGGGPFRFRDRSADPYAEPERITVAEAFDRFGGIDLLATLHPTDPAGEPDRERLAAGARAAGVALAVDDPWSDIYSRVLAEKVEPHLGDDRPAILYEYPSHEAALARPTVHDPRVAERFELFACGVELANAFGELTDPVEQRRRFTLEMAEKRRIYGEDYPLDEDFLAALATMPATSGIALGFDRLVMLALGAPRIEDVLWAPVAG